MLAQLECLAAESGADFVGPILPALKAINERMRRAKTAGAAHRLDVEWHETLTGVARNARLQSMMKNLRLEISRFERAYMSEADLIDGSARQHDQIVKSLSSRRIDEAMSGLRENYLLSMRVLLRAMGES
ncbi:MAG: FCD domain-containing protein [Hyphomonadaceae bacterium]